jgi:hypothetical protein
MTCWTCGVGCPICGTCNCNNTLQIPSDTDNNIVISWPTEKSVTDKALDVVIDQVRIALEVQQDIEKAERLLELAKKIKEISNG